MYMYKYKQVLGTYFMHINSSRNGQGGRSSSEPAGGLTTLKGDPPGPGFRVRSDI